MMCVFVNGNNFLMFWVAGSIVKMISLLEESIEIAIKNPDNLLSPCMVSSEGACAAYYKYR
jgi:hydrogenase maturation factor